MARNICSVDDCERVVNGRGLCLMHYKRWQRHGDPLLRMRPKIERFLERTAEVGDCLEWTGDRSRYGYGVVILDGTGKRKTGAHRWIWSHHYGPIAEGMEVCHTCDNPPCVKIDHLFLGTHQDNMDDMNRKGRNVGAPRKTHCIRGHEYTPENTIQQDGGKSCRTCRNDHDRQRRHEAKVAKFRRQRGVSGDEAVEVERGPFRVEVGDTWAIVDVENCGDPKAFKVSDAELYELWLALGAALSGGTVARL